MMNAYERGELKGQKLNRKQLSSTPEFKQHLFLPIHNLPMDFQEHILQEVHRKNLSLLEMKLSAVKFRSMDVIKRTFVRITCSKSWDEACVRFPDFVTHDQLEKFLSLNFKLGVPEVFRNYCDAALTITNGGPGVVRGRSKTLLVCRSFNSVAAQDILSVDPQYTGAHLIMTSIPNVSYHQSY